MSSNSRRLPPEDRRFPAELLHFTQLFNDGAFWESHEVLEGPWRDAGSEFYHGLILYASAFVHLQRENAHGVVAQLRKAERALAPFAPLWLGVDVDEALETCRRIRRRVEALRNEPATQGDRRLPEVTTHIAPPVLRLDPALIRGDEPELRGPGA